MFHLYAKDFVILHSENIIMAYYMYGAIKLNDTYLRNA